MIARSALNTRQLAIKSLPSSCSYSSSQYDFKDEIKDEIEKLVVRKPIPKNLGRIQSWREPIYHAPHQHIFEQSPDFSFKDGRQVHVTSQKQLDYKLDQIRLTKKIVELLKETKEVEEIHRKQVEMRNKALMEEESRRPMEKGSMSIC